MKPAPLPWYRQLYVQVLLAVALGIVVGWLFPTVGKALEPLGRGFVALIKMIIAPIIFCTVVHGIASMSDVKKLGRIGLKTIIYFEFVSTLALIIGLVVVNYFQPGAGFNFVPGPDAVDIGQKYAQQAHSLDFTSFLLSIIPSTFASAFVEGNLLQVLLIAILTAFALGSMGEAGQKALAAIETASKLFFAIMRIVVRAAPVGAFGAMAFTVGSYGVGSLGRLVALMLAFYATSAIFVVVVLGTIAWINGFSIFRFLVYIKEELILALGTSSSEPALPGLMLKTKRLGCSESTVGLVIPMGYSFNLDGTNIYMTMATMFLAQATNTHLSLGQQLTLLAVAMLSSKGASGVSGAGFITLAATLSVLPAVPIASIALLVGIDRFMSECRALTNLIGNGVATIVISRWEKELSYANIQAQLSPSKPVDIQTSQV